MLVRGSLETTGGGLQVLSRAFFYKPEWREALKDAGIVALTTSEKTDQGLQVAIDTTNKAFEKALFTVNNTVKKTDDLIYDNRVVSSILGSSHDQKFKLTRIQMSFRGEGVDWTIEDVIKDWKEKGSKPIILFVPGLLTDETVWKENWTPYKRKRIRTKGISTELEKLGFHGIFVRFNHGLPIHENGKKLSEIFEIFQEHLPDSNPHIISYSLGGLVLRSALFYGNQQNAEWPKKVQKVVMISSPNRGSYLEKIGFWLGMILEKSPNLFLKVLGIIGNLRSDAIKDLSFGLIRKEPKSFFTPISRYFQDPYHGELDEVDAYEAYSLLDDAKNPIQNFLGDGIVEKQSLSYLSNRVFAAKPRPDLRTLEIVKANHFSILKRKELFSWLDQIFRES